MTMDLDEWIAQLAAAPTDRGLDGLEAQLGREIGVRRREAGAVKALAPVRLVAMGLALAMGVTTGGMAGLAAIHAPLSAGPFDAATRLAPSTLLEGVG